MAAVVKPGTKEEMFAHLLKMIANNKDIAQPDRKIPNILGDVAQKPPCAEKSIPRAKI